MWYTGTAMIDPAHPPGPAVAALEREVRAMLASAHRT